MSAGVLTQTVLSGSPAVGPFEVPLFGRCISPRQQGDLSGCDLQKCRRWLAQFALVEVPAKHSAQSCGWIEGCWPCGWEDSGGIQRCSSAMQAHDFWDKDWFFVGCQASMHQSSVFASCVPKLILVEVCSMQYESISNMQQYVWIWSP